MTPYFILCMSGLCEDEYSEEYKKKLGMDLDKHCNFKTDHLWSLGKFQQVTTKWKQRNS